MKTAFQTGPGLYAVRTTETNPEIPKGKIRVYCVRLEAYDLDKSEQADLQTNFKVLPAMAQDSRETSRALADLAGSMESNRHLFRE